MRALFTELESAESSSVRLNIPGRSAQSLAFCAANPELSATILDFPQTIDTTRRNAEEARIGAAAAANVEQSFSAVKLDPLGHQANELVATSCIAIKLPPLHEPPHRQTNRWHNR